MRAAINTVKNVIEKGKWYVYHAEHKKKAGKYLQSIEAIKGKLDPKNVKLCKEYARDIFGNERYAPWLIVYCTYAQEFKEGWIPDNYYGEVVVPNFNGLYGDICNRTVVISNLLQETDSLDICYYANLLFLSPNYEILNEEKIKKFLFAKNEKVVFKVENSRQGKGIYIFDEKSFDIDVIRNLGNGVFQSFIEQHPFFSEFNNSSVATIRITSICDDNGNIDVNSGFFKFGRKGETHVQSASAIYIHIDVKTGKLGEDAYFPNWETMKHLPDNDIPFAGRVLPSFDACVAEVKRMHSRIPFIRCVGWDLIVDKDNKVKLIELNGGHNGIVFNEVFQGPCFKGLGWEGIKK
ncbi:sugar-transfer associated ATP-grasp domain-containing protein [uncultured Winogradskyella sp.]|mgnify:FL=1|uniref:sugar-transfer associated ATP-grasp domain-containing protein n=1 Tax=uncultured Winogradskyella sp. TaxID=395353 RepID=UPI0030DC31A5|tara:strand:- start:145 stop:1194 length:1050 start_codon:yes stop_codon:yes gene_type:complete